MPRLTGFVENADTYTMANLHRKSVLIATTHKLIMKFYVRIIRMKAAKQLGSEAAKRNLDAKRQRCKEAKSVSGIAAISRHSERIAKESS